jgi:hypothetical protein
MFVMMMMMASINFIESRCWASIDRTLMDGAFLLIRPRSSVLCCYMFGHANYTHSSGIFKSTPFKNKKS